MRAETETVHRIETPAGALHCREHAPAAAGPTLLLLHGSGFSGAVFAGLMTHPALAACRLLALDLPGHGGSDDARHQASDYSLPGFAAAVAAVLRARAAAGCVLLGWSLGGDIAMQCLALPAARALLRGLVLVSAPPAPPGLFGKLRAYTLTGLPLALKPRMTARDAARFERDCLGAAAAGHFIETLRRTDPAMRPGLARAALRDPGLDQRQAVRGAGLPVWLVAGGEDPLLRLGWFRRFAAGPLPPGSAAWLVPAAGHAPFLDAPDDFAARLAAFTRACCAPPAAAAHPAAAPEPAHA